MQSIALVRAGHVLAHALNTERSERSKFDRCPCEPRFHTAGRRHSFTNKGSRSPPVRTKTDGVGPAFCDA